MSTSVSLSVKWGKQVIEIETWDVTSANAISKLFEMLQEKTQVPVDRMKVLSKTKGLWKGVLKGGFDLSTIDWSKHAASKINLMLMGSAAKLAEPAKKTVFLEDLPPEELAKTLEPSGLQNLGNTCYLNSVVQCLRVIPQVRRGLQVYLTSQANAASANNANSLFLASLAQTYTSLDAQSDAVQPAALVQFTKMAFPQFNQRNNANGSPMQQDAEEFYSSLLTLGSQVEGNREAMLKAAMMPTSDDNNNTDAANTSTPNNWIDGIFGARLEETLTCDECESEPPVVTYDLHRKLTCNIQSAGNNSGTTITSGSATTDVAHIMDGLQLFLNGTMEKRSDVLDRDNATWTRTTRIARLPPILTIQFGRFYWKVTPNSQDHAGVKCKIMKPVSFQSTLDVYDFCNAALQKRLNVHRQAALAAEEDAIQRKLQGQVDGTKHSGDSKMEEEDADADDNAKKRAKTEDNKMQVDNSGGGDDDAEDLQAALAMSMMDDGDDNAKFVGPGLPDNFQGHYELFAVVTHKGRDADGGHYMAWVKADNDKSGSKEVDKIADSDVPNEDWFVFDDDEVSPCKTEDVLKLKGGGDWHMSYLNFYRAKK